MASKYLFLTIGLMVLLSFLFLGCTSAATEIAPTEVEPSPTTVELTPTTVEPSPTTVELTPTPVELTPTPTPGTSIVWTDDFEDGDISDWEEMNPIVVFSVEDGALTAGPERGGDILHMSDVSSGTWSFDLFLSDKTGSKYVLGVTCDEGFIYCFGIETDTLQNTSIYVINRKSGNLVKVEKYEAEGQITGWNHFDITRDEGGNSKVYLKGELILEYKDELSITPHWFYFSAPIGPALDNLVVRNQVVAIPLPE